MFAVVDLETTGLNPARNHRIVEIGVVLLDPQFRAVHEWQTLINPGRDLGATDIHGITSDMVLDAPHFAEIAGDLHDLLQGSAVVAHNAAFDMGFLRSEFTRACCEWPVLQGVCTMHLAASAGLPRSLAGACQALGIEHLHAHAALDDARATGQLFAEVGQIYRNQTLDGTWPPHQHPLAHSGATRTRDAEPRVPGGDYLAQLLTLLPPATPARPGGETDAVLTYKGVLDRALEDRVLDGSEAIDLAGVATLWGLTFHDVAQAHRDYLLELAHAALSDGIVTPDERADLVRVAVLLGGVASDVDAALHEVRARPITRPSVRPDLSGLTVCFTGASLCMYDGHYLSRSASEALAAERGLVPKPSVTKALDILVVADPDTQSGKVTKARANGTRVIAERQFWAMLRVDVT